MKDGLVAIWCPEVWAEHLGELRQRAGAGAREWTPDRESFAAAHTEMLAAAPAVLHVPAVAALGQSCYYAPSLAALGELAAAGTQVRSLAEPGMVMTTAAVRRALAALGAGAMDGQRALRSAASAAGYADRLDRGEPFVMTLPGRRTSGSGRKPNATYGQVRAWAVTQRTVSGTRIEAQFHVRDTTARAYMAQLEAEGIIELKYRYRAARVIAERRRRKPSREKLTKAREARYPAPRPPVPRPKPESLEDIRERQADEVRRRRAPGMGGQPSAARGSGLA